MRVLGGNNPQTSWFFFSFAVHDLITNRAYQNRQVGTTNMNEHSSRSHW
jgi:hypothetical protein